MLNQPRSAALYCRISDDRTGQRAGVKRQEDDCRALAESRGWPIAGIYTDNDLSAYSGKPRPAYRRLLEDMKASSVDAVVVWHLDRLHRSPKELEEFFEIAEGSGVRAMATVTGNIDLSSDDGRFHARILGAVARKESDDKSRRIRRKMESLAQSGNGHGGGTRPFGFEADRLTIRESEAEVIREAATRVLAGESLRSLARDFEDRGIPTVTGTAWGTTVLRRVLIAPRTAGLREHHGIVVAEASWPAILDRDMHERLVVRLTDRRRIKTTGGSARRYLLTGFAHCGLCGHKLVARPKADGRRCYVCASGPDFGGCGKIRQLAEPLEDLVAEALVAALDGPELAKVLRGAGVESEERALFASLRDDEDALEQLARDHYADKLISRSEYLAARQVIESRVDATKARLARVETSRTLSDIRAGHVAAMWEERPLGWRRALLATVIERVIVNPAVQGRNFFDAERVEVRWKV